MTINKCFELLETQSSIINHLAFRGYIKFAPGYFFMLLSFSTFLLSALLDLIFIVLIFLVEKNFLYGVVFLTTALCPITFAFIFNVSHMHNLHRENLPPMKWYHYACFLFTFYFGLFSLNMGGIPIKSFFEERKERCRIVFPLFHISNEVIATLKIYYFFFTISKSIPQMFAIPAYFVTYNVNMWTALVGRTSILQNMVLFSLTMAILFPVRKTPKYFRSLSIAFLNAASKFFGAMCACGLRVIVFTETYKTMGFYALIIPLLRIGLALGPSIKTVYEVHPNYPYVYTIMYAPLIETVLSFLYIHPFSLKGTPYYYIIYLLNFLIDIFSVYVFTKAENECIIIVICLSVISAACISCFGLINFFNKKVCRMVCLPKRLISAEFANEEEITSFSSQEPKNLNV